MALETLKGVQEIGGFEIGCVNDGTDTSDTFIHINHKFNAIAFKIQNGTVKENGVNGCQVVTILETALLILQKLNEKFPCIENIASINYLKPAIHWQHGRTRDRVARGVEGTSQA